MAPAGVPFLFWWTNGFLWKPPPAGDQFPGVPRWLSGQAGTFYPLTALSRRNLTPRQTHLTFRDCQGIAPRRGAPLKCGRNLRFPHKRPLQKRGAGVCDWLSLCGRVFFHRRIIPLLTLFFSASGSQKTAVTPLEERRQMPFGLPPPAGGSVPWRPPMAERAGGYLLPSHCSVPEESHTQASPPRFPGTPEICSPLGGLRLVRFLL